SKTFRVATYRAEFIAQLFNIFNRANFNAPNTSLTAGNDTAGRPPFRQSTTVLPHINAPPRQAGVAVRFQSSRMAGISVLVFLIVATAVGRTAPADTAAASLSEFFAPGIVFQDRNGDGAIDFVDARLVLAEQPSSAELAAAADVAARLGFETSAMDIPVVRLKPHATNGAGATTFNSRRAP